jgi:hypothetical protein
MANCILLAFASEGRAAGLLIVLPFSPFCREKLHLNQFMYGLCKLSITY